MGKKISKIKVIFEDSTLTDLQKYKKINDLTNKRFSLWFVFISLNSIILPLFFFPPNVKIDNQNLIPILASRDLKK
tara:strand:- start:797 stop:1024 length:228 start_codon:yes stop_codon:yes gene_type:complete